jgi:hypothetical protein
MLHITPTIKLLDKTIESNSANHLQIITKPLCGSIHSSMSHINGVVTNLKGDFINEESPLDGYDGGA